MMSKHLLIVTRELAQDQIYGLGKSIAPVKVELESLGWCVTYFSQAFMSEEEMACKSQLVTRAKKVFWALHFRNASLIEALVERLYIGHLAAVFAQKHQVSHVHLHDPWLAVGYELSAFFGKIKSKLNPQSLGSEKSMLKRVGLSEHGFGAYFQAVRLDGVHMGGLALFVLKVLERQICRQMDWVIAPTELALKQLALDLGLTSPKDQIEFKTPFSKDQSSIQGSFPTHWFKVLHTLPDMEHLARSQARERIGVPQDAKLILSVGRLAPLKQFDLLIDIFAQLSPKFEKLHLFILGGGDQGTLQRQTRALGVESQVSFAFSNDVSLYYSAADVYISASLTESFGLANLEALAYGLPCVCSQVGGVPEVVKEAALLVHPSREGLMVGLQAVLADPLLAQSLSDRASVHAKNWPSTTEITQRYVQIYQ